MRSTLTASVLLVLTALVSVPARADDPAAQPLATAADAAIARYREGARLLQEGKAAEALVELDASLAAMPSANTELLRAHALRLLRRRVEALEAYASVERAAGARVRAGEDRYRETLEDCGRWLALLRTELGEIAVTIRYAGPGASIAIDGRAAPAAHDPGTSTLRARVWHEPGQSVVTIVTAAGATEQRIVADVGAGAVRSIDVSGTPPPTPAPAPADRPSSAMPPTVSWIAWGVGVAGFATFAIFGSMAQAAADDLDACRPLCAQSLKDRADDGERDETIANVSLVVGALGVVGGGVAWIVSAAAGSDGPHAARVLVTPGRTGVAAGVRASF